MNNTPNIASASGSTVPGEPVRRGPLRQHRDQSDRRRRTGRRGHLRRSRVLRVWGLGRRSGQLIVALRRRQLGGQWAMIVSGSISTVAGISFFLQAAAPRASLSTLAGYALLDGDFFLVSALRLGRKAGQSTGGRS